MSLSIDGERLKADLLELAKIGADPRGGVSRVAYTPADIEGRNWVQARMQALGLTTRIHAAGNLIGFLPGAEAQLPPIMLGSHTDTVIQGGIFDGALGVLGALACIDALNRNRVALRHPVEVVSFACEEAVYGGGTLGSRAMSGQWDASALSYDVGGETLADRVRASGLDPDRMGSAARPPGSVAAYLELHIEQGGTLEADGVSIGVVEGIVAIRRYDVVFLGQANHAGTTTMEQRRDSLVWAAEFILAVRETALRMGGGMVGTVGRIGVEPGAGNVIPGRAELGLELRALSETALDGAEAELAARAAAIGPNEFRRHSLKPSVHCDPLLLAELDAACDDLGLRHRRMPSGAGHDAMCIAAIAPVAMLFVPSRSGISHSPDEWTDWDDCAAGASALYQALLRLDRRLDG